MEVLFGKKINGKADVVKELAERTGFEKTKTEKFVNAFLELIRDKLSKGEEVAFSGFGKFSVSERNERSGINPKTKEKITIPARKAPVFKSGSELKKIVNN